MDLFPITIVEMKRKREVTGYTRGRKLGTGGFGVVVKLNHPTKEDLALKLSQSSSDKSLRNEIAILKILGDHPNIVKMVTYDLEVPKFTMELADGNLTSVVKGKISPAQINGYMKDILTGIAHCHRMGVIHQDIKPENILSFGGRLKLADFGISEEFIEPMEYHNITTRYYRAPEILLESPTYDSSVDMWAVGCVFAYIYRRIALFCGDCEIDQMYQIFRVLGTPGESTWPGVTLFPGYSTLFQKWNPVDISKILPTISKTGKNLLMRMLKYHSRITAEEALKHPYFKES